MAYPVLPLGFLGGQGDSDIYRINRSLRFNSADLAYLNRTFGTATTQNKFTLSLWAKLGVLGAARNIFSVSTNHVFGFTAGNALNLTFGGTSALTTSAIFRDPAAWYHIMWVQDGTSHTIYVNGASVGTATATSSVFNTAVAHQIGAENTTTRINYFNGYMTEIIFVDGQSLTQASFGETDSITGRWKAKPYSGTYGTNGFYLNFSDNSGVTATTLGKDSSGNGNNWTPNNFSVTAGVGNDSLLDSPTSVSTSGNFCTWSSIINGDIVANGNLDVTNDTARGTQALLQYDSYWEVTSTGGTTTAGIISDTGGTNTTTIAAGKTYGFRLTTAGALDYINITDAGAWVSITTGVTGVVFPYASAPTSTTASLNCGQRDWAGSLPTGYKEIRTANIPTPVISKPSRHADAVIYTGTGSAFSPTSSLEFPPDLVLIKSRGTGDFSFYDSTRGTEDRLESNTDDEVTADGGVTSFDAQGFSVGTLAQVNTNAANYVAWAWRKASLCGFDIVSYTGNGANRTISHNLGAVPRMMMVKARTTASTDQGWVVYHAATSSTPQTEYLRLDNTSALQTSATTIWNSTAPTSSVFSLGTSALVNANNDTYIAYLFSQIDGFSRFGSYSGNSSNDGLFVWLGFRPRIILIRNTGSTHGFRIFDSARNTSNVTSNALDFNTTGSETTINVDFLSNGFKLRDSAGSVNAANYIYSAFAESPFKYARAR